VQFGSGTEDWDKISAGTTTATATTGIINDKFNTTADNQFTGGGAKDTNDFGQWLWTLGKPQSKDDFEHGYAAAYSRSSDSHLIIVAGVDRYDNSGSSTAGFWFVQDPKVGSGTVTCDSNGVCSPATCSVSSGCAFGGTHTDGDFLIISQFSQGGAISTIQVYVWTGGAGGNIGSPITSIGGLSTGQCDPRTGNLGLCGTVNGVPVLTGGWAFTPKHATGCSSTGTGSGTVTTNCMDTGEFLEIGVDVTGLFAGLNKPLPCISKFFAETRSSGTGLTSSLSDFVTPTNFPLCGLSATKTCTGASINSDGATVTYNFNGTISNTGIGTLSNVSVSDVPDNGTIATSSSPGVISGSLSVTQPSLTTLTAKGTANSSTTYSGTFNTNFISSTLPNTATGSGTTPEGDTLTKNASWLTGTPPALPSNCVPAGSGCLNLVPTCSTKIASGNPLSVEVDFTGSITNNANVQVSGITITSTPSATVTVSCGTAASSQCSGTNGSLTLAPGASATFSGSYDTSTCTPSTDGRCSFQPSVTASGTGALGAGTISACMTANATCHLCPATTCSTGN
jgi:hypothetical protein